MDCRRAWDLMMKSFDKEISELLESELNTHVNECASCKARFDKLTKVFAFMETAVWQAPADIEKRVMTKLNSVRQKRDFLMPYVIFNFIVFTTIVVYWLDNLLSINIFTFAKDLLNEIVVAYNTSVTIIATYRSFFNTYFVRPTVNIAIIAGIIYGLLSIASFLQKMRRRCVS
ncbi:MAG: hypothetical protein GX022_09420 [Clostridiaceae bacterium]|nr:hypothetical protein [Clostridiaceae bacterium]